MTGSTVVLSEKRKVQEDFESRNCNFYTQKGSGYSTLGYTPHVVFVTSSRILSVTTFERRIVRSEKALREECTLGWQM